MYWNIHGTVAVARWMASRLEKAEVPPDVLADAAVFSSACREWSFG